MSRFLPGKWIVLPLVGLLWLLLFSFVWFSDRLIVVAQAGERLVISPSRPTVNDNIVVTYSGTWPNACIPQKSTWFRTGNQIRIDTAPASRDCLQVSTEFNLPVQLGRLPAGTYQVAVYYNERLRTQTSLTVTEGRSEPITLTANPTSIPAGGTVTVTWRGIPSPQSLDWVGLFAPGASDGASIQLVRTGGLAAGSLGFKIPDTQPAGTYQFRLFSGSTFNRLAISNPITVTRSGGGSGPITLTASPTSVPAGGSVTVTWNGIPSPKPQDWVGLFVPGTSDGASIWFYPTGGRASGSLGFKIPDAQPAGTYEFRLFAGATNSRLAVSNAITVTRSGGGNGPITLTASPTSIAAGGTVTVAWSGIPSPKPQDWVGLFVPGTSDGASIWFYRTGGTANGSVGFKIPDAQPAGTYEFRLFSDATNTNRLAVSNRIAVTGTGGGTGPIVLTASPTSIPAGGTVTITWSGIPSPKPQDWVGLFVPGTSDDASIWFYRTGGTPSGSLGFKIPDSQSDGNYEFRLFSDATNNRLAVSNRIAVTGNVKPDIDVYPSSIDFGEVAVSGTKTAQLWIRNQGQAPLLVSSVALAISSSSPFSFCAGRPGTMSVGAGEAQSVQVCFSPQATGVFRDTITIRSNDPDESTVTTPLTGRTPDIQPGNCPDVSRDSFFVNRDPDGRTGYRWPPTITYQLGDPITYTFRMIGTGRALLRFIEYTLETPPSSRWERTVVNDYPVEAGRTYTFPSTVVGRPGPRALIAFIYRSSQVPCFAHEYAYQVIGGPIEISGPCMVCAGDAQVQFTAFVNGQPQPAFWSLNGGPFAGPQNPGLFTFPTAGEYTIAAKPGLTDTPVALTVYAAKPGQSPDAVSAFTYTVVHEEEPWEQWRDDKYKNILGRTEPVLTWAISVYSDCTAKTWRCRLTQADVKIRWFAVRRDRQEASPEVATEENYCKMIRDLSFHGYGEGTKWVVLKAIEEHEKAHIEDYLITYDTVFARFKTNVEQLSLEHECGMTLQQAADRMSEMTKRVVDETKQLIDQLRKTHGDQEPFDPWTWAAESRVIDPIIENIEKKARANGWASCPVELGVNVDRGCGQAYPIGSPIIISYIASRDAVVTLRVRMPDGSEQIVVPSQAVKARVPNTISTVIGDVVGPRVLILEGVSDSVSAPKECSFTVVGR